MKSARRGRILHPSGSDPARLVFPGFTLGKQDPREAEALVRLGVSPIGDWEQRWSEASAEVLGLS